MACSLPFLGFGATILVLTATTGNDVVRAACAIAALTIVVRKLAKD